MQTHECIQQRESYDTKPDNAQGTNTWLECFGGGGALLGHMQQGASEQSRHAGTHVSPTSVSAEQASQSNSAEYVSNVAKQCLVCRAELEQNLRDSQQRMRVR